MIRNLGTYVILQNWYLRILNPACTKAVFQTHPPVLRKCINSTPPLCPPALFFQLISPLFISPPYPLLSEVPSLLLDSLPSIPQPSCILCLLFVPCIMFPHSFSSSSNYLSSSNPLLHHCLSTFSSSCPCFQFHFIVEYLQNTSSTDQQCKKKKKF